MDVLASSLDNAYFVVVKRNPVFVAQSLLLARKEIQGSRDIGWGLGCNHVSDIHPSDSSSGLHQVAQQVAWIYSTMEEQKQTVPTDRLITIEYEAFCQNPNALVSEIYNRVWQHIPGTPTRPKPLDAFKASQRIRLPQDEFDQLQDLVHHYLMLYKTEAKQFA